MTEMEIGFPGQKNKNIFRLVMEFSVSLLLCTLLLSTRFVRSFIYLLIISHSEYTLPRKCEGFFPGANHLAIVNE